MRRWPITFAKRNGMSPSSLRELKNGGVELRLKLSSLAEIERWILGWGGDAVAIKPPRLVEAVQQAAKKILTASAP